MSEAVGVIEQGIAAWNDRDFEAALALISPDVQVEVAIGSPLDGTMRGRDAVVAWLAEFWAQFGDFHTDLSDLRAFGDQVLFEARHTGRGKRSGVPVDWSHWQVCTVREGHVVRWLVSTTRDKAVAAAGLPALDNA